MAKKTVQVVSAIVALAAAIFIGIRSERPAAAAAASFSPPEINLGDELWGQVIPIELSLQNHGNEPLTIADAKSSCGCAVLEKDSYQNRVVEAGGVLKVNLNLDTKNSTGRKQRTVTLISSAGDEFTATILLNVTGTWRVAPEYVNFDEVTVGARKAAITQVATFESDSDELLDISIESAPWLECRRGEQTDNRTELVVQVLPEMLERGKNFGTIQLKTSSEVKPTASIVVTVIGVYELTAKPDPIVMLFNDRRRVEFFDPAADRVRITSARVSDPAINCAVLDDGAVEVWETGEESSVEKPRLIVEDEAGRSRAVLISRF